MTLDDIKAMTGDWITPATAAKVLKMDPGRLIWYVKNKQVPFSVRISGNRALISRKSFLACYDGEAEKNQNANMQEIVAELREIAAELRGIRQMLAEIIGKREAV